MGTDYTVHLIYGWKLELGDLENDNDVIYEAINDLYGKKMKMIYDVDVTDGGEVFFGFGKSSQYDEYIVGVGYEEIQRGLRDNLETTMKAIKHDGMRMVIEMAMQKPAQLWAVIEVSY